VAVKLSRVTVNGIAMEVEEHGSGRPLLLVHGFPLDRTMWSEQYGALAPRCRLLAADLRGFGGSEVTPGTVSMQQYADDLAGLMAALGIREPVVYCGLSMGGYIAWEFWRRHRDRVAAFVLCDTRAAADNPQAAAGRRDSAQRVLREGPGFLAETLVEKLFAAQTRNVHPERIEAVRQVIRRSDREGIAAALLGMAVRDDQTSRLDKIDVPALLLCGAEDVISPVAEMRAMAAALPAARFVEIPAAGHMAPLENPAAVNAALLEFLNGLG
jgi:pimeloyl-ACP methyl ester carboxylesterase